MWYRQTPQTCNMVPPSGASFPCWSGMWRFPFLWSTRLSSSGAAYRNVPLGFSVEDVANVDPPISSNTVERPKSGEVRIEWCSNGGHRLLTGVTISVMRRSQSYLIIVFVIEWNFNAVTDADYELGIFPHALRSLRRLLRHMETPLYVRW